MVKSNLFCTWAFHVGVITIFSIGVVSTGMFDFNGLKNTLFQIKSQKFNKCPDNRNNLQSLLSLVCASAQPTNITLRDGCINCFARVSSASQNMQIVSALSLCALQYFMNTPYATCAMGIMALATSGVNMGANILGCYDGYCDFVMCLRRVNSRSLIVQCTREARTGVNITVDADNVRFFVNVTSCILAKARCGSFSPITGAPQTPGYTGNSRVSNALQIASNGDLRIISFPAETKVANPFCSSSTNLTQTNWLNNGC